MAEITKHPRSDTRHIQDPTMKLYFIIFFFSLLAPVIARIEDFLNNTSLLAHENSMPFIVSIEKTILRKSTTNNQCTGMAVSFDWVTTSCTCLLQMNKEDRLFTWPPAILFKLTGGVTNKRSKFAQVRFATKISYHPKCNLELKTMDVALMRANYPFSRESVREGMLTTLPIASQQVEFIGAGLDTFIKRRLTCAVFGWPTLPGHQFDYLMELNVVLVPDEECGDIACEYAPGLCSGRNTHASEHKNRTENSKGIGLVCAKAVNTLPPCAGFEGAPLVCGTNVWATVTAMDPCNETIANDTILMTRLDVQFDFLKTASSKLSSTEAILLLWFLVSLKLIINL